MWDQIVGEIMAVETIAVGRAIQDLDRLQRLLERDGGGR
jgi:hypothetical protein